MPVENNSDVFNLREITIMEINAAFNKGIITSKELVMMYLDRIARFDKDDYKINSVLEINPDALYIAEAMDIERSLKGPRSPLHGIPILIKDNISTKDRMHTSAGSLSLKDSYAPYDAFLVKKLRESGAVILGKTNMTEFANFMSYNMPSGYSSRGGQVLNPYGNMNFTPGGSSSGSGAATACNFCAAAIGTETSGSILSPCSQNSIVGIKPTVGLVSRTGIIPISHSQDTAGPMARCVADAALLLSCMTGIDNEDPSTLCGRDRAFTDYCSFLNADGLNGKRIGIPRDYYLDELSEEQMSIFNETLKTLKLKGAEIVDHTDIKTARNFDSMDVLLYEFKSGLNAYLASLGSGTAVHSLREIIEFNNIHQSEALKYGQAILLESENTSGTLTEPQYIKERLHNIHAAQVEGIDEVMERFKLDSLLFAGTAGADIAARAGYPSITVPGGCTKDGEPLGITFTGKAFTEPSLISIAYSYEQASKKRINLKW